jgi:hypothetical protein
MQLRLLCLLLCAPLAMQAQWRVALTAGSSTVRGDARDDADTDRPELRDDHPSTIRLALGRDAGAWRISAGVERIGADISESSASTAIITPAALHAWGAMAEAGRRVAGHRGTAALYLLVGGELINWSFDLADASSRSRGAVEGAAEFDFPVGRRWSAVVRGEVATGGSVFAVDELPDGFARINRRRSGVNLGIARLF